jgi:hypothetical protein
MEKYRTVDQEREKLNKTWHQLKCEAQERSGRGCLIFLILELRHVPVRLADDDEDSYPSPRKTYTLEVPEDQPELQNVNPILQNSFKILNYHSSLVSHRCTITTYFGLVVVALHWYS